MQAGVGQAPQPSQARSLIKARYFERLGLRDWVFACANRPPELALQADAATIICHQHFL